MTSHSTRGILPLLAAASLVLSACSGGPSGATREESAKAPSSGATEGAADVRPGWKLLSDKPEGVPLDPGAYGLIANGVSDHLAVVKAPAGYQQLGGFLFVTGEPFRAMGFHVADLVPPDPCGSKAHSKFDAEVDPGPSVKDLAEALVAQKGAETSEPVPVTIDGHKGLYLTYQVARGIDVLQCEAHAFDVFSTGPGAWYLEASRERAAIWILPVGGERLVLAWEAVPGVSQAQMREMTRMVQSARFVESS
jgi:hypothetical protein